MTRLTTPIARPDPHIATVVTRTLLERDGVAHIYAKDAPGIRLLSEADRANSLAKILATRPAGDIWIFGYGSLIWNPALKTAEQRIARLNGWHRAFCMSIIAGRASISNPGLMLGLDEGGHCLGTAYRLDHTDIESELPLLWRREMQCRAYIPRWVELFGPDGPTFGHAIAFTMDSDCEKYAGRLPTETMVQRLATAKGGLGSCADYLFQTRDSLRANGIPDAKIERLAARVQDAIIIPPRRSDRG